MLINITLSPGKLVFFFAMFVCLPAPVRDFDLGASGKSQTMRDFSELIINLPRDTLKLL